MAIEFTFSLVQAVIVAIALPIVTICLFYLMIPRLKVGPGSRLRRYLSYLDTPPRIETTQSPNMTWRNDKIRLYYYYLAIVLFLVSFAISEFYEVMMDLLLPVSQGSTGEMRVALSVIFESVFSAGWIGSLPWTGVIAYHETWNWIFFTAAFTDNPNFLSTVVGILTLISMGVGLVYLAPLAIRRIRRSFFPSMFFFTTGMTIFTKAATSCLAYTLALAGGVELEYISMTATGSMIPDLLTVIGIMLPIVIAMFAFFIVIGQKLWKTHYTDSKSRTWFIVYIALSFWLGIALTIMVV
ncbi:MAG: hypothetical protein ACFFBL_04615 [Promethearchaeota archaeon]